MLKPRTKYLTATEAAALLDPPVKVSRMSQLIKAGRVPAEKIGRVWFIREIDLRLLKNRKPGWKLGKKRTPENFPVDNTG